MGRAEQKAKSQAMAQHMKEKKITRTSQQCPICNAQVSLKTYYTHIVTHK